MTLAISMILLKADSPLSAADVQSQLAKHWPDLPEASIIEDSDDIVSLEIDEESIILAKMPAPIPWSDLEGPCATSILWQNATEEVKQHRIHWIVTLNAELDPVELSTRLTQVTAAALAACKSAIGVYWGNATLLVPRKIFLSSARETLPEGPPIDIWVDFRVGRDSPKSSSGFTAGMQALGHMEFETERSPEPPGELRERLVGLAGYVIENGPVINNGDTVGQDADERIKVIYSDSAFGHDDQVMRLVYETESAGKPWWKLW